MRSPNRANRLASLVAATAAVLAGCAGTPGISPVSQAYYDYSFVGSEIGYIRQFGPLPVFIKGSPFASERDNLAMIEVMNHNHAAQGIQFAPTTTPSASGYSVVLAFGQPAGGVNYCAGRADFPLAPSARGLQITGVFCLGGRLRSTAVVTTDAASNAFSPQMAAAIDILTSTLLSPEIESLRRRLTFGG